MTCSPSPPAWPACPASACPRAWSMACPSACKSSARRSTSRPSCVLPTPSNSPPSGTRCARPWRRWRRRRVPDNAYEAVIGLECHVQLATRSKMFCGCPSHYAGAAPNSHVCPICLGMPGVLPVMNRVSVEYTLLTGLAMNAEIPEATKFDRKNYPYPDLVKGYQISQYDLPLVNGGWLEVSDGPTPRRIHLERVHLEEDTGKLTHVPGGSL